MECKFKQYCLDYSETSATCNDTSGTYYAIGRGGGCYRTLSSDELSRKAHSIALRVLKIQKNPTARDLQEIKAIAVEIRQEVDRRLLIFVQR